MRYIYGPVKSRRLGYSLGVSLTPYKICNFNCVYCQLGKTKELSVERKEYAKIDEVISELKSWFINNIEEAKSLNYITISGSGEPTLNTRLASAIKEIKKITPLSMAVITNASLLNDAEVRGALSQVSLIVPSLGAADREIFAKLNRPAASLNLKDVISGLINLRKEFKGEIWLEVMLVGGINDDLRQIRKLKEIIEEINPDKIQLNSPLRVTAEPGILPVEKGKLEKIKEILGPRCEIV